MLQAIRRFISDYRHWFSGSYVPDDWNPPRYGTKRDGKPTDIGQLTPATPAKGGHNDLSRWAAFGGALQRPTPPAPIASPPRPIIKRRSF